MASHRNSLDLTSDLFKFYDYSWFSRRLFLQGNPPKIPVEMYEPTAFNKLYFYFIVLVLSIPSFTVGYNFSCFNLVHGHLQNNYSVEKSEQEDQNSQITSTFFLGMLAGSLVVSLMLTTFGRRMTLLSAALTNIVANIMSVVPNVPLIVFARFILGATAAINYSSVKVYLNEVLPNSIKPKAFALTDLSLGFGVLSAALMGLGFNVSDEYYDDNWWKVIFVLPVYLNVLFIINVYGFVNFDTPLFSLFRYADIKEGKRVLKKFYKTQKEVDEFVEHCEAYVIDSESKAAHYKINRFALKDVLMFGLNKKNLHCLSLALYLSFCGFETILVYSNSIFTIFEGRNEATSITINIYLGLIAGWIGSKVTGDLVVGKFKLLVSLLSSVVSHALFIWMVHSKEATKAQYSAVILVFVNTFLTLPGIQRALKDSCKEKECLFVFSLSLIASFTVLFLFPKHLFEENATNFMWVNFGISLILVYLGVNFIPDQGKPDIAEQIDKSNRE